MEDIEIVWVILSALLAVQVVLLHGVWRAVNAAHVAVASELQDQTNELKAISELLGERRRDPADWE